MLVEFKSIFKVNFECVSMFVTEPEFVLSSEINFSQLILISVFCFNTCLAEILLKK